MKDKTTNPINEGRLGFEPPNPSRPRWIEEGELTCSGPGCNKPIPAGWYGWNKRTFSCSLQCELNRRAANRKPMRCLCCGQLFQRKHSGHTRPFLNREHYAIWRKQQLEARAGRFAAVLREYTEQLRPKRYSQSTVNDVRSTLVAFFEFLNGSRIRSLNRVTPEHITKFLAGRSDKRNANMVSLLVVFFDWLRLVGKRKAENPVVPRFHRPRTPKRLPRVYSDREMALIWELLKEHGDLQLMAAVAAGQESAARIGEIAALRLGDVDLEHQQLFIDWRNKTQTERVVPFHDEAKKYLTRWLEARGQRNHDRVFVGVSGRPMAKQTLRKLLKRVLCGEGKLARFSFHKLRGTAATRLARGGAELNAITQNLGWRNPAVAQGYIDLNSLDTRDSYRRAMEARPARVAMRPTVQSMAEFFSKDESSPTSPSPTKG